ncbi:hypothetical protein CXB51_025946 [Gossypium anomalum]|uniref:Peptidase S8/S53 domain-containing protein n=1 Tax=Gossypium anomalum TaxID=47600 RepID=A0A8J6CRY1_9ROSI|nr:hypothetical protein CXB51_025946 [Gossypium anomalum]
MFKFENLLWIKKKNIALMTKKKFQWKKSINVNRECFEDKHIPILESSHLNISFKRKALTKAARLVNFNFLEDLNGHGTACSSITGNPFARIASYKVSDDKLQNSLLDAMNKVTLGKVYVIMVSLSTDTLSNLSLYLCDPVNINHGDRYYTLSRGLAPLVINIGSCNSGRKFITQGLDSFMDKDGDYCELIHLSEYEQVKEKKLNPKLKHLSYKRKKMENRKDVKGKTCCLRDRKDGTKIQKYIGNSKKKAFYEEQVGDLCKVSLKSRKGLNPYDPYVLKPDICAPGEDILCANKYDAQNMYAHYQLMSGTSTANAIVAGSYPTLRHFRRIGE